ncbi:MAG: cyclic nucleotide-binding domain-containing protein [Planctomycetes bacterium]|nr:cyclic nucleotide-binding domain-containing protein [Planctomycetota bacterium]
MNIKKLVFTEKKVRFNKDETVFEEEDEGRKMYFIESGRVKIVKKVREGEATLVNLDAGAFFGEMSLITGNKRVASAIALTDCKLHTMDKETFESNLVCDKAFLWKILETLASRIEEADMQLKQNIQRIDRLSKTFNNTG